MKGDRIFVDTNILVYAYDISAGTKHDIARGLISGIWDAQNGVLSTQVVQELYVSVTKKIPKPLDLQKAKEIVRDLLQWEVIVNDGVSVLDAIEIQAKYRYSFWDALIITAALKGGADILMSEDLADGQDIEGLIIRNPFAKDL
jgi:predicted nucleic acid-binding protein